MADDNRDEALREMAAHRGFRLVKSRRRKPGAGDYGRYGLADAGSGAECFGFGAGGLTATPEEIENYLRSGGVSSWKTSVASAGGKAKRAGARPARAREAAEPPPRAAPKAKEAQQAPPPPQPEPELRIRKAAKADGAAIAALLGEGDAREVEARLAALARAKAPVLVADKGAIVGVVACDVVQALHRPPIGRITVVAVAGRARRQGIGTALIERAEADLGELGCGSIEAISDIEIDSAHGFFRSLGYTQTSYRFAKRPPG